MYKNLIFTATYNEAENITEFLEKVLNLNNQCDILIIDDNSPDQTSKIVEKIAKEKINIKLITRNSKEGLNTAHIMAYEYANKNNYQKLVTLDSDLSHDPSEIPKILDLLDKYPFVIGSRYLKNGKNNQALFRFLISYFGNKLIKLLSGINGTEFTTSYRGFNLSKLDNFNLKMIKSKGYSFFMGTILKINELGYPYTEFPIIFTDRKFGKSKIPKIEIFRTFTNLIKYIFLKKY